MSSVGGSVATPVGGAGLGWLAVALCRDGAGGGWCLSLALWHDASWPANGFVFVVFFLVTLLVTVVMLNVLISIVGDAYEEVSMRRREEALNRKAGWIVQLEATYLSWCVRRCMLRGREFLVFEYHQKLLHDVGLDSYGATTLKVDFKDESSEEGNIEQWEGRIKSLTNKVQKAEDRTKAKIDVLAEEVQGIKGMLTTMMRSLQRLEPRVD
ncbi:hypothetical protein T484DRAFT_1833104, partial [Baffinella frigidus]